MVLLSVCFLLLTVCLSAVATDDRERHARCVAHCVDYDQDAKTLDEMYSCQTATCLQCRMPCNNLSVSLSECKASCASRYCNDSCEFIESMGNASADNFVRPARPGIPHLNGSRLEWDKKDYRAYSKEKNRPQGVVFLLLGSKALVKSDGSVDTEHLSWDISILKIARLETAVSEIDSWMKLDCGHSYVFKVAAFNELGTRGYKMSHSYTTDELLNKHCNSWHSIGSCRPTYCNPNFSFVRAPIDLHLNNSDGGPYLWNGTCSNLQASRVVVWSQPRDIATDDTNFCYEVYVSSGCDMGNRVYYVLGKETDIVLEHLQPGCSYSVSLYAGTLETSRLSAVDKDFALNFTVTGTSSACGQSYHLINFAIKSLIFNETSELYRITLTWNNPPGPVDYFTLSLQSDTLKNLQLDTPGTIGFFTELKINAVKSFSYVYTHFVDVVPGLCFKRIQVLPVLKDNGYKTSQLTDICAPSLSPSPPENVTVYGTADSITIRWQEPTVIHSHYPIVGYLVMWAPVTDDLGQLDPNDPFTDTHIVLPSVMEYTVTGLLPNHQYLFQVRALSEAGNSSFTDVITQRTAGSPSSSDSIPIVLIAGPVAGVVVLIIIIVIIAVIAIRKEKHKLQDYVEQLELESFHPPVLPRAAFNAEEEPDEWEIEPWNLFLLDLLGEGFFGVVIKGELRHLGPPVTRNNVRPLGTLGYGRKRKSIYLRMEKTVVACKMLKEMGTMEDQTDLLEEISLMKKIAQHRHIVSILGCITRSHPVCLIVEYCEHGDLLHYLRDSRPTWLHAQKNDSKQVDDYYSSVPEHLRDAQGYVPMAALGSVAPEQAAGSEIGDMEEESSSPILTSVDLLSFARQIALGMEYLAEKGLVHRDLACRNVLVAEDNLLKISDFGLTRAVHKDAAYTQQSRGRMPLKWMALESITDRIFTTESDIWSYGIVLWEICTLGCFPYPTIPNFQLLKRLLNNYRMECPENCSEEMYSIMLQCWHPDPDSRPPFSTLVTAIEDMMDNEKAGLYVDLNFEAHNRYWMSISQWDDDDDDPDSELTVPTQDAYLQPVSFAQGRSRVDGVVTRTAKLAPKLPDLNEEEVVNDPFLGQPVNKTCHTDNEQAQLHNGHSTVVKEAGKGVSNGKPVMNTVTLLVDGDRSDGETSL